MMTWTTPPRRLRASPAGPGPSRTSQPARHPCATPMAERRRIDWRCRRVAWTTESRARAKDPGRGGRARRVARRTMPMRRGRTSRRGSVREVTPLFRVGESYWLTEDRSAQKLQPTQTRDTACLMTQKSLQSRPDTLAGGYHSIRTSAPRHSSTRPRDVTKARIASDIQRSPRTKRTQPRTCVHSPARRSARRPAIPPRPFRAVQPPRPRSDGPLTDVVSTSSRRLSALNETPNVRNELR